jgi:uncharacterized membrane protein YgdD (TMEM256/DUF423 family)
MHNKFLPIGALSGAITVALGAFGAHGLQQIITDEKVLHGFQTGVQYQMYHTLALLIVAIIYERLPSKLLNRAASAFIAGIICFSGSLYLSTALFAKQIDVPLFIRLITPAGGVLFIAGWLLLFFGVLKKN